jgi:hypothetical protein
MDLMWLVWGWIIGVPVVSILIARYGLWTAYDDFMDEFIYSVAICVGIGLIWPLVIVFLLVLGLTLPTHRVRELLADFGPRPRELEQMDREELIEKVRYLQNQVDKNVKKELEKLKKEYAS